MVLTLNGLGARSGKTTHLDAGVTAAPYGGTTILSVLS
jgi:hypothetical protein